MLSVRCAAAHARAVVSGPTARRGAVDHEAEVAVRQGQGEALVAEAEDDGVGHGARGLGRRLRGGWGVAHEALEVEREEVLGMGGREHASEK